MKTILSVSAVALFLLSGCGGGSDASTPTLNTITLDTKEKLGEALFFDANLSLTRNTSCATCHNPEHGFIDARFREADTDQNLFIHGAFSVGDDGVSLGGRNTPTATYAMFSPTFSKMENENYKGGQFHDGRAINLADQAGRPPLDSAEMMMSDQNAVINRIKENDAYMAAFKALYSAAIFDDINVSYEAMRESIAKFEKTDLFAPFDSKYDRFRECLESGKGEGTCLAEGNWSADEEFGKSLFFSNANTNCATCHTLNSVSEASLGTKEMFTNYEYENIGTPRNHEAMDARAALGLQDTNATFRGLGATVEATDVNYTNHLGKTKVPTLRNIAITGPYMNNGVFAKLRTVLEFYDHQAGKGHHLNPETGGIWVANDNNVSINTTVLVATEALSDRRIMALEAFLNTLTDQRYEHLIPILAPEGALGN